MLYLPISHPLARTISFVLKGNADISVLPYGDRQTFYDLWHNGLESLSPKIAGQELDCGDEQRVILIIGEDLPDAIIRNAPECLKGINFRDHFTASSWLAAWKIRFESENPSARVMIIDSLQTEPTGATRQTVRVLFNARDDYGNAIVPRVATMSSPSLESLCDQLHEEKEGIPQIPLSVTSLLRAALWNGLTSDRETNHAISNVLGALLLARETRGAEASVSGLERALECLVQPLLNLPKAERKTEPWWKESVEPSFSHIALIDDMAELWSPFLRGALGLVGTEHGRFLTLPKATFRDAILTLPSRLAHFLASGTANLSTNDLLQNWPNKASSFILFLDLRLFPNTNAPRNQSDAQIRFTKDLAAFGLKLLDSRRNLPWLGNDGRKRLHVEFTKFTSRKISGAFDTTVSGLPPQETLLPRLLALLDPTLPIVIFSSTHRSELIDPFRDYGNIITAFRKPILSDMARDWNEIVEELRADLRSAMEQATSILEVRRLLKQLEPANP